MKKILWLWLACVSLLWSTDAILQLDTGGHQGLIRNVIVTHDGKFITGSDDKTVRVWDPKTGQEERKILGNIGAGNEGMVYAIALSPDEKILAVGGYLNTNGDYEYGQIRLYDFASGQIIQILKGHENVINGLAFDEKGNLYSGSFDGVVKMWKNSSGRYSLQASYNSHSDAVQALAAIPGTSTYVSVGYDNMVKLYDQRRGEIRSYRNSGKLQYLASSPQYIAACGYSEKKILIFDTKLNLVRTISSSTTPTGLAFSPDGNTLVAGTGGYPYQAITYDVRNDFAKIATFTEHTNLTMGLAFLDNDTVISAGGDDKEMFVWDAQSGQKIKQIIGEGKVIWRVALQDKYVGVGNRYDATGDYHTADSRVQKVFDLESMSFVDPSNVTFPIMDSSGFRYQEGSNYGHTDATLIFPNGTQVTRDSYIGYRHNTFGKYRNMVFTGGMNGNLAAYDMRGNLLSNFVGHTGEVWDISVDGDTLISGGDDQIIYLWDINQVGKTSKILPKLSLFIGNDNEWVAWTPSGYYASSSKGDRYVGWHINQGPDKESLFYPVGKFKNKYYNPDLIALIVDGYSEKDALAKLGKREQQVAITDALPPFITPAQFPEITTSGSDVSVKVRVVSRSPLTGYKYLFNGRPLETTKGLKPAVDSTGVITLNLTIPKENGKLSIIAINGSGYSDPADFEVTYTGAKEDFMKPNLYIVAIGVSNYEDKDLTLQFAAKDAKDFANAWQSQKGKLYRDVTTKVLTDTDATKDNILDALEWIQRQTTSRDVAIIYIGGHGINDEAGQFYYLPVGVNTDKIKRTGVAFSEFTNTLSAISGKVMLFADACHSGNIMGARKGVDSNGMIAELNDAENGVIVYMSSTGKQYSLEDPSWGNGAFTKAVVEGLSGKADLMHNGKITINSLGVYISERVKELTGGRQTPKMGSPDTISDFPISLK